MKPFKCLHCVVLLVVAVFATHSVAWAEWKEKVLYSFHGLPDGSLPAGGVVFDTAGNLYGATTEGGSNSCPGIGQCGTVYQLVPPAKKGDPWTETVLYIFLGKNHNDGETPAGSVIIDDAGNLYGTTAYGGAGSCTLLGTNVGCGTVYKLSLPTQKGGPWTETVLYSFKGGTDGQLPVGDLVFDKQGDLYGATQYGGGHGSCNPSFYQHCGTVFKLNPPKTKGGEWTEKLLHGFKGVAAGKQFGDGANPNGGLVLDGTGTLYGTTYFGGNNQKGRCEGGVGGTGCGIVFALQPPTTKGGVWTEKLLYRFQGGQDGDNCAAGLIFGGDGDLYGTTLTGGPRGGGGTVFRLTPSSRNSGLWKEVILHGFDGTGGGLDVESPVIFGSNGNLYGTTLDSGGTYYGTVFQLIHPKQTGGTWTSSLLHGFHAPPDGGQPAAGLVFDKSRNLYSTTTQGGSGSACSFHGCGTVFEVSP